MVQVINHCQHIQELTKYPILTIGFTFMGPWYRDESVGNFPANMQHFTDFLELRPEHLLITILQQEELLVIF